MSGYFILMFINCLKARFKSYHGLCIPSNVFLWWTIPIPPGCTAEHTGLHIVLRSLRTAKKSWYTIHILPAVSSIHHNRHVSAAETGVGRNLPARPTPKLSRGIGGQSTSPLSITRQLRPHPPPHPPPRTSSPETGGLLKTKSSTSPSPLATSL